MIMMKKTVAVLLAVLCCFGILSGCTEKPENQNDKISIVCTVAPVYDWLCEIVSEKTELFEINCLSGSGDLHSFQPTAQDMSKILSCDLFVTIGGETEEWTQKLKPSEKTKRLELIKLVPDSELICMSDRHHDHEGDGHTADEHIWLSLKQAQRAVSGISEALCDIDAANGVIYQKNEAEYIERLKDLDKQFTDEVNKYSERVLIFADRFPFGYMMQDYEISYYAAFSGCSTDADASFETVAKLCDAIERHDKHTVIELENSNQSITSALDSALKNIDITAVVMDSCQTVGKNELEEFDYIEVMTKNLEAMSKALE